MSRRKHILEQVSKGNLKVEEAERILRALAIEEVGELAKIDIGRDIRKSIPEVILAEGKNSQDIIKISLKMLESEGRAIISRIKKEDIDAIKRAVPKNVRVDIYEPARIVILKSNNFPQEKTGGKIGILTAGTCDIPIAEEAKVIAEEMGCDVFVAYDVGVAGIHRLIPPLKRMIEEDVDVIIVIAGREGALPTVVAGLVDVPVIAVPTSSGYGLGGKGIGALMAMLQSCSLGLAVVNIDGGVAAGAVAALIANRVAKFKKK